MRRAFNEPDNVEYLRVGSLQCGLSWEAVADSAWKAYTEAFLGLFPGSQAPAAIPHDTPEHAAFFAQVKLLLLQGEGLENRKFRGLAIEFYEGYRAALNLPPGDPSPEVILPWEAVVRHLAQFLECADEDEAQDAVATVGWWRQWASGQLQVATADAAIIGSEVSA